MLRYQCMLEYYIFQFVRVEWFYISRVSTVWCIAATKLQMNYNLVSSMHSIGVYMQKMVD